MDNSKFNYIFEKTLRITLDRIKIPSEKQENKCVVKPNVTNSIGQRVTRSKKVENAHLQWVRISNGKYSGDLGKVVSFDSEVHLELFPRINYDANKRSRPAARPLQPEMLRKNGDEIKLESKYWIWNGDRYLSNGLLLKSFAVCDVIMDGVIPTPTEMRRFKGIEQKLVCDVPKLVAEKRVAPDASKPKANKKIRLDTEPKKKIRIDSQLKPRTITTKKAKTTRRKNQLALITPPDLTKYAVCWVKVRGYKDWPGVIESVNADGKYKIHFFGDYSVSNVFRSKITNFFEGFSLFNDTFDDVKLKKAVKEACICLTATPEPHACLVCEILNLKSKY